MDDVGAAGRWLDRIVDAGEGSCGVDVVACARLMRGRLGLEELSQEDRRIVNRARRLERFLTQPFFVTVRPMCSLRKSRRLTRGSSGVG